MERTLSAAVFDLLAEPNLPEPARRAAEMVDAQAAAGVNPREAETSLRPLQWLLDRVGPDGLPLTQAGYLRPVDVTALMHELGWHTWWIGKSNREDQTYPARMLREAAIAAKMVRKQKGTLRLTRAGRAVSGDPVAMWFHVADQLPADAGDGGQVAAVLMMLRTLLDATAAAGSVTASTAFQPEEVFTQLGWRTGDGQPVSRYHFTHVTPRTSGILKALGMSPLGEHQQPPATRLKFLQAALTRPIPTDSSTLTRLPSGRARQCHTLTIRLNDVTPEVWRTIQVPSSITLLGLHRAIQAAMGWEDYHLFAIQPSDGQRYGYPDPEFSLTTDAKKRTLKQGLPHVGDTATYEYDFGDGWTHSITVDDISTSRDAPTILAGANACPPEDVGGPWGYEEYLEALADPRHERHAELLGWRGPFDPHRYDKESAEAALTHQLSLK